MDKDILKKMVREALNFGEASHMPPAHLPLKKKRSRQGDKKEYADIQNALKNTLLKKSQVMAAAGLGDPDDATDRSLFNKKVNQEPNQQGSRYKFDDKELSQVQKVISNPKSYLHKGDSKK